MNSRWKWILSCVLFGSFAGCSTSIEVAQHEAFETQDAPSQLPSPSVPVRTVSQVKVKPAASWPNWMGPKYDGVSKEKGWSTDWPDDGLSLDWSRQIGIGFSSVSIADGRLFTMGHVDGTEYVYALNVETGKPIWTHSYDCQLVDNLHEGGPGSTPTIDGDFVYTLGREGQLFCFQADDGEIVWSKELQRDLDVDLPEWGFTSSAYILGDQLILEAGRVVSYDKRTGNKNWQTDRHSAGYGSAISFKQDGSVLLATLDCEGLRIVRSDDGRQVAFEEWDSPFETNSTTPIVRNGLIYISSGYGKGCGLFRLNNDRLENIYTSRRMRNHFNNSILLDGYLYGFDGNSNLGRVVRLTCMDFNTGQVAWAERGMGCGSLMIADGKLLILGEDGTLIVAKATPKGLQELARSAFLEGRCWTVPVLLNGHVYGRNASGNLVSVSLPK